MNEPQQPPVPTRPVAPEVPVGQQVPVGGRGRQDEAEQVAGAVRPLRTDAHGLPLPTATPRRGVFVVFEGGDSAGKSTQVRRLARHLTERGVRHVLTHEPGDSWLGQEVRRLVLSPDSGDITARAECLLYIADKAQHVVEVVRPALERGEVVVCDRYVDSTIAYQAAGRDLPAAAVEAIARWATADLRPDLTVLLDADPRQAVSRIVEKDRIEQAGEDFHQRVRDGFLELASRDPQHYLVLPARDSIESIAERVAARVDELLAVSFADEVEKLSQGSGTVVM